MRRNFVNEAPLQRAWDTTHHLPTGGDATGRAVADAGGDNETTPEGGGCSNSLEMTALDASGRDLAAAGGSAPRRTRTYNPLIKSQAIDRPKSKTTGNLRVAPTPMATIWPPTLV